MYVYTIHCTCTHIRVNTNLYMRNYIIIVIYARLIVPGTCRILGAFIFKHFSILRTYIYTYHSPPSYSNFFRIIFYAMLNLYVLFLYIVFVL